jgi:Ni,Fe-hydrogenase III large subunit/Ni,Fe-hydrogenase III component G
MPSPASWPSSGAPVAEIDASFAPGLLGPEGDVDLRHVHAADLAATTARFVSLGARFEMLVGLDERSVGGDGLAVEVVLASPRGSLRLRAELPLDDPSYPSVARLVPAALWDERECKDMLGIVPVGHPDPRRLVLHERWPAGYHPLRKDVPADVAPPTGDRHYVPFEVHGEGVYQLPVGPIHAGVIEPGHFRFSAVGERVLHLDARLFFTHRGLEKLVEGRSFESALPIVERACGVCTVAHALAYAMAVEALTGTPVPPRAAWSRVILAELERLYNHVGDLGNICAGIGFQSGVARLGALKERLLRLNEGVSGHRYLMGLVGPGGLRIELDAAGLDALAAELAPLDRDLASAVRSVIRSEGVMARLRGTGFVPAELARTLGATGIAAKASADPSDLRRDRPYGAYAELATDTVARSTGDVAARFHVRAQEAHASIAMLGIALDRLEDGPVRVPLAGLPAPGAVAVVAAEGPRGASRVWLRAGADGTVDRFHLRSASFANWPVVAAAVPGDLVADFPLINKSFELCYACTDR